MIAGISDKYATQILNLFRTLPRGVEIILFGSRAKGNFREGSDIDIAIRGPSLTLKHRDELLALYEALYLPWKLDLVIYHLIDEPALKAHIDRVGKLLHPDFL